MSLTISAIRDAGILNKERIVMRVNQDLDIGDFALLRTGYNNGTSEVTTRVYNALWFPNKMLKRGDFVVVYTKRGRSSQKEFDDHLSHFFYWGENSSLWDKPDVAAVLLTAPEWQSFIPKG
jgi:hypothetical protein